MRMTRNIPQRSGTTRARGRAGPWEGPWDKPKTMKEGGLVPTPGIEPGTY